MDSDNLAQTIILVLRIFNLIRARLLFYLQRDKISKKNKSTALSRILVCL
jgi:hypothetical protein